MSGPNLRDAVVAVEREIVMRHAVYPRRVTAKKMSQAKADWEIACMELVLANLKDLIEFTAPTHRLDDAHDRSPS